MSFSYSGDPAGSEIDTVRFLSQDVDKTDAFLSDEELQYLVDTWLPISGSLIMVAAHACEVIAAKFAREVAYSADGVSVSANELQDKYDRLALSLRDMHKQFKEAGEGPDAGGMLWDDFLDPSIKPTMWQIGMHDNLRAGPQEIDRPLTQLELEGWI